MAEPFGIFSLSRYRFSRDLLFGRQKVTKINLYKVPICAREVEILI
jgi:hypothetical protein